MNKKFDKIGQNFKFIFSPLSQDVFPGVDIVIFFPSLSKQHEINCGLYYKHVMIVNDSSSIVSKRSFKLIVDPRVFIYDRRRFIIQATGVFVLCKSFRIDKYLKGRPEHTEAQDRVEPGSTN